MELIKSG